MQYDELGGPDDELDEVGGQYIQVKSTIPITQLYP
jgi:hypothetical protein